MAEIHVFLCGDVMTGRGIDQILPFPSDRRLHEPYVEDALDYVALAERRSGPLPRPFAFSYVWGDALGEWAARAPDVRLVNLETSVTTSDEAWPKGINYRMHPKNVPCLLAAQIDGCCLANNHVLDWGRAGLLETLDTLRGAGVATAGAGRDLDEAEAPAIFEVPGRGRVLVFSFSEPTSGSPRAWAAGAHEPGLAVLEDLGPQTARRVAARVSAWKRAGDVVITSIHWGGNWGYEVPREQATFARALIDEAGVDVVHGHSSHHPKGIEVHAGKPILYGCGDFLDDYEGIKGHESYRGDLTLMYFVRLDAPSGRLIELRMVPLRIHRFRLNHVAHADARWLAETLHHEGQRFGTEVVLDEDDTLLLRWTP
ncbi:CapA family protein [Polyangium spumosum]|uniref:Poly-gamma-glutamate biosynthesis protein n=1 Tax=Polyangium spumosum TaxID=889282 RepID=A0A6N7PZM0_9BACT|nr:CapA family protein [Polyangium spumosum]MRG97548.1 poly-gamma-glutamate biosynthesis protein [Polyangium spumosum]